jgi:hypothetical protein
MSKDDKKRDDELVAENPGPITTEQLNDAVNRYVQIAPWAQSDRLALLRSSVTAQLGQLNEDETEAVSYFVRKLIDGKAKHGALDLATDARDFRGDEIRAELMDAAFYAVFDDMRRKRDRGRK